jgi:hypothetical protein
MMEGKERRRKRNYIVIGPGRVINKRRAAQPKTERKIIEKCS